MTNRRSFLFGAGALIGLTACGKPSDIDSALLDRAKALIAKRPSLDLHAHPGKTFIRGAKHLAAAMKAFTLGGASEKRAISDMQTGGVDTAVFAAVADFQILDLADQGIAAHRPFKPGEAQESYKTQIANLNAIVTGGLASPILNPADVVSAKRAGKPGAMFGVEGGDFLGGSAERVSEAYADGVRCIGIMHYHTNELGDIMTDTPVHNGLTEAGTTVIQAMNNTGVIIDIAHAEEQTAFSVLETSDRPVVCSHTHIKTAEFEFPRFISLNLAKEIAAAGGVIGAWPAGIGISDLNGYVDRVFELIDAVGVDHVGMGTDMDANYKPVWDDYKQFPEVVAKMLERGLSDQETAKIIGGNGMRVFEAVAA